MDSYRMTISRDRLAEFRRNSAVLAGNDSTLQHLQQPRRASLGPQQVRSYYSHQPPTSKLSNLVSESHTKKIDPPNTSNNSLASNEAFFLKIEEIQKLISTINENVREIESLRASALSSINEEHSSQVNQLLDDLVSKTSKLNRNTKNCIKELELANAKLSLNSSDHHMRATQLQALKKKFVETIQRYQKIERTFEKKSRQRMERQIRIVNPEATPQEIEMAIDSDDAPQIFAHSLLTQSRTGDAVQALNEVQTRHRDIKRIEKTIMELHNLFLEMQQMVEMQQETIVNIEKSSEGVNYELEEGNKHVTTAVSTAKSTRKKKLFCFIIFVILLVVAGILVWWFAFPKARSSQLTDANIILAVNGGDSLGAKAGAPSNSSKETNMV